VYVFKGVQIHQDGLKINGTHQLLFYAHDVNMLGGSVYTTKENTEALVVSSKETGLEITVDKSTYMFMSRYRNTGRSPREGVIIFPLKV
jgi:hypothetical protein